MPIQFKDQSGTPQGLIVDLMNEAAKEMGVEIEWVDLPWDSLIPSLTSGKIDMVAANMSVTLKRWTTIRFSKPYMLTGVAVMVKKNSGITDWRDLMKPPRKLGTTMGSAHHSYLRDKFGYDASAYESWLDGSNVCKTGGIDGMMDDELLLMEFTKQNPDMMLLPELVRPDAYALGFRQGAPEDTLVRWFDWFLTWEKLTGFYGDVYQKWIGKEWRPDPIIQ
jgi:polar amino acid transport system substrate-binding protein